MHEMTLTAWLRHRGQELCEWWRGVYGRRWRAECARIVGTRLAWLPAEGLAAVPDDVLVRHARDLARLEAEAWSRGWRPGGSVPIPERRLQGVVQHLCGVLERLCWLPDYSWAPLLAESVPSYAFLPGIFRLLDAARTADVVTRGRWPQWLAMPDDRVDADVVLWLAPEVVRTGNPFHTSAGLAATFDGVCWGLYPGAGEIRPPLRGLLHRDVRARPNQVGTISAA